MTGSIGSLKGMVATPWGQSESLREQKLRPGPGTPAEEVANNQRQRLFGAMVASVAERGYSGTRIADLVEISGVNRRTFYNLFPDKRSCCVATIEAMVETGLMLTRTSVGAVDDPPAIWEEQIRAGI